jgi:hypothetical protein
VYKLATEVRTVGGGVIKQNVTRSLVIDGTAPELITGGLVDGVAWTPQEQLSAILKDIDPQAKLKYAIKNGTLQFSAVLDATLPNIDGNKKTANLSLKTLSELGFTGPTDGSISKQTEISLEVTDRAGNVQTQTLRGMLLNLPDLTDEAFMLSRSNPGYTTTGTADTKTPPTGTWLPQATVGTSTNQALYIGPNGAWGYAQAGTGTGAGGNGIAVGTISWVPATQYNPVTTGGTSTPPLPPAPTLPPNIPALLDYIPALEVIFKTATDVLSGHPQTNAKRSVLQNTQSQLVSTGRVVQEYGLYDVMQASLSGVYKSAYVAGGKLSRTTAVQLGWKLAQDLAKSGISTKVQVFESSLVAAIHGAERLNGKTLTATQTAEVRTTVQGLARNYARLNPLPEQSNILEGYQAKGMDALWNFQSFMPSTTNGLISSDAILQYPKSQF